MNYKQRKIMMKLMPHIVILCIILMMSSCRFSEECNYTGNVQIVMDWESLWGDIEKPDTLNTFFYRGERASAQRMLLGDTIYENIPSGETNMIVINQPVGTEYVGLEYLPEAEIHLPTYFEGNIRAVNECPMICAFNGNMTVPIEGVVKQVVTPLPIIKQMIFVVHIVKEGVTGNVTSCQASLSGISTGYSLNKQEAVRSKATVFFPLSRYEDPEDNEVYKHHFFVLGVNPAKLGEDIIEKKLSVTVTLDDGEVKSEELDLTAELDHFTSNIFKCEVMVKITSVSTSVEIASWKQGAWGQIVIQ